MRLGSVISAKGKRIAQAYAALGKTYYEMHRNDPQPEECISEINGLNAEIFQCREAIKQIKGVTKCPKCGADVPLGTAFCNACGAKMERSDKSLREEG